ncbi:hypothetical protein RFI_09666 [Reticulomyxa filosa]|uniref:Uncharacterized protein n=1 Tax=Reticulomyxa filosa TaxID=46433 RepID=X6NP61_RETFI|nr:hypothetical protein RFI_09666 [Reticulomyxa filosa]|eukprot:ETO27469.1 hypothetical protein RFI_09666 [Reticulomyxa filosa]
MYNDKKKGMLGLIELCQFHCFAQHHFGVQSQNVTMESEVLDNATLVGDATKFSEQTSYSGDIKINRSPGSVDSEKDNGSAMPAPEQIAMEIVQLESVNTVSLESTTQSADDAQSLSTIEKMLPKNLFGRVTKQIWFKTKSDLRDDSSLLKSNILSFSYRLDKHTLLTFPSNIPRSTIVFDDKLTLQEKANRLVDVREIKREEKRGGKREREKRR